MNKGTFWNSVNDAVKLLKKLNFIREVNIHKNFSYSQKEISHPQIEMNYCIVKIMTCYFMIIPFFSLV